MKKYVKITNEGVITKEAIELLGYSDKRGDNAKIGNKGSGLKFSRFQALRKGLGFYVATSTFINHIETKEISKGNERIVFKYNHKDKKNETVKSSFTLMAGADDWKDDWFILREIIQNARDEFITNGSDKAMKEAVDSIRVVSEIKYADEGKTSVYIEASERIIEVINNIEKYIKVDETTVFHPKVDENANIYLQGIFVGEMNEVSLYDYNLSKIELSESREVKYWWVVGESILEAYTAAGIPMIKQLLRFLYKQNKGEGNIFEMNRLLNSSASVIMPKINLRKQAFYEEFTEDALLHHDYTYSDYQSERVKDCNKYIIVLPEEIYSYLSHEVETLSDFMVGNDENEYKIVEQTGRINFALEKAKERVEKYVPIKVPIKIFKATSSSQLKTKGLYSTETKRIYINVEVINDEKRLFTVLLEEAVHAMYGVEDFTREMQNILFGMIGDKEFGLSYNLSGEVDKT